MKRMPRKGVKPHPPVKTQENGSDAADVLWGAEAIAEFLNGFVHPPISRMAVYKLISTGALPAGHLGARVIGSKRRIRARLERLLGN
jgi:hypothetical protein